MRYFEEWFDEDTYVTGEEMEYTTPRMYVCADVSASYNRRGSKMVLNPEFNYEYFEFVRYDENGEETECSDDPRAMTDEEFKEYYQFCLDHFDKTIDYD